MLFWFDPFLVAPCVAMFLVFCSMIISFMLWWLIVMIITVALPRLVIPVFIFPLFEFMFYCLLVIEPSSIVVLPTVIELSF